MHTLEKEFLWLYLTKEWYKIKQNKTKTHITLDQHGHFQIDSNIVKAAKQTFRNTITDKAHEDL